MMNEDRPAVDLRESLAGSGILRRAQSTVEISSFALTRSKYDYGSEWHLVAHGEQIAGRELDALLRPGYTPIELDGFSDVGSPVYAPRVRFRYATGRRFEAAVDDVVIGERDLPADPQSQHLVVGLSTTPLALDEVEWVTRWWTGELKENSELAARQQPRPETFVTLSVGPARFSRRYAWGSVDVGGVESVVRVPTPALAIALPPEARTARPFQLTERLADELDDVTRVLAFLSRRDVHWARMEIRSRWEPSAVPEGMRGRLAPSSTLTRVQARGFATGRGKREPLVNARGLPASALDGLIANYRGLPYKDAARAAIVYMNAARDAAFVEPKLASAFTALEALVNGIGEHDRSFATIGSSSFRTLTRRLRATIEAFAAEKRFTPATTEAVIRKLPELRRRPIVDRLTELFKQHQVEWEDLWPAGIELPAALAEAYRRRNHFVHAGHLESGWHADTDADRVLILTERLLYRLIGGDPGWYSPLSFYEARYLAVEDPIAHDGADGAQGDNEEPS